MEEPNQPSNTPAPRDFIENKSPQSTRPAEYVRPVLQSTQRRIVQPLSYDRPLAAPVNAPPAVSLPPQAPSQPVPAPTTVPAPNAPNNVTPSQSAPQQLPPTPQPVAPEPMQPPQIQPPAAVASTPAVAAQPSAMSTAQPSPTTAPAQSGTNNYSIYPDARAGQGISMMDQRPADSVPAAKAAPQWAGSKIISAIVMVFGAFLIITAGTSLLGWLRVSHATGLSIGNGVSTIGVVISGLELLFGIGIIMRREIARAGYVGLAVLVLIFSFYTTFNYFRVIHSFNGLEKQVAAQTAQQIATTQNDGGLTATAKKETVQVLQSTLNNQKQIVGTVTNKVILPIIEGYIISLIPLILLTRPAVKRVFR